MFTDVHGAVHGFLATPAEVPGTLAAVLKEFFDQHGEKSLGGKTLKRYREMADYLDYVRSHYASRTEWFETDLAWNPRDAMEITQYVPRS